MKAWMRSTLAVVACLGLASVALAQCGAKAEATAQSDGKSATCSRDKAAYAKDGAKCSDKALAACMPKMAYKVGDKTVCCPKEASELAAGKDADIHYVVAEKEYADKAEALKAYETVLNERLATMTTVRYAVNGKCVACPNAAAALAKDSGDKVKYQVAAYVFADQATAEQAATAARAASEKVTMTKVVDGKEYTCTKSATACGSKGEGKELARAEGKTCEYKVGDTKSCCPLTAEVELAKARIQAAYDAVRQIAEKDGAGQVVASGV